MDLKDRLDGFFKERRIFLHAVLPLSDCIVTDAALLEKEAPGARTAILYVLPYLTGRTEEHNISLYAQSGDYHLLIRKTNGELKDFLQPLLPGASFAGFGDRSPFDERRTFASAGLGVLGDNGLLITKRYGSFVFLGEVTADADPALLGAAKTSSPAGCLHCGACKSACPTHFEDCASGYSQKKGELTGKEKEAVLKTGLVWGCDLCQTVCPLNRNAEASPLPFFYEDRVAVLTKARLDAMSRKELRARAFGWRGRQPLLRNLALFEDAKKEEKKV